VLPAWFLEKVFPLAGVPFFDIPAGMVMAWGGDRPENEPAQASHERLQAHLDRPLLLGLGGGGLTGGPEALG